MDQRSLLRKNRNKIIEEMVNPVEVSDVLCMKGVFTWYMVEEVQVYIGCALKICLQVSDLVQHRLGCTTTEDGHRLEISVMKKRDCTFYELVSCLVTMQLMCAFVLVYVSSLFSHEAAQL